MDLEKAISSDKPRIVTSDGSKIWTHDLPPPPNLKNKELMGTKHIAGFRENPLKWQVTYNDKW